MKKSEGTFPLTIEIEGEEIKALCDFTFYPYIPGKTRGPVEGCYPEEPESIEFDNLRTEEEEGIFNVNLEFLRDILSPNFEETLEKRWREWCEEQSK